MKRKLYLVRHGESEWNKLQRIQGHKNIPLSEMGRYQASKLAKRLKNEEIDLIYSSDLKRAFETAKIVGDELGIEVTPLEAFREIRMGVWEGLSIEEVIKNYPEEHLKWMNEPHNFHLEGAETLLDLQKRSIKAVNKIFEANPNKNIMIVSHSATIKVIILGILNMDLSYYSKMSLNNVSLSIIEFRDYNNVLKLLNDTCHLRED